MGLCFTLGQNETPLSCDMGRRPRGSFGVTHKKKLAPHRYPPQSTIIFVSFVYNRRHLRLGAALIAGPSAPNAARPGAVPHPCSHLSSTTHLAGAPRAHESMRTLSLRAGADSGACMCWQARTRADGRPHERTSAHATTASVNDNPCSRQKVHHSWPAN